MKRPAKKIALLGLCTAIAMVLAWVEIQLPPLVASIPGIKLGLPNIVILYVLYTLDWRMAATVSLTRLLISSLLFGNVLTLAYSAAGALLSLLVMLLLKRLDLFSSVGVSVAGGVSHNLGQILVAMLLLDTPQIALYMLVLAVTGTISGILVGLCAALLIKRLPPQKIFRS